MFSINITIVGWFPKSYQKLFCDQENMGLFLVYIDKPLTKTQKRNKFTLRSCSFNCQNTVGYIMWRVEIKILIKGTTGKQFCMKM